MSHIINCPYCNRQYLPGEIFEPKYFLGQPKNIVRNSLGEILGYEGINQDFDETYICDECNKEFKVTVKHSYSVLIEKNEDKEPDFEQLKLF